ncbi:hypothetical protein B0I33_11023 [Prauserella shujinwangii]|uniref:Uncharacterized protein n=1 Tax=Prauserella shujinwangii TaxID=1453103 RepID=A0A2T0LNW6_9PSEU|nr:hypothetical protein [Prauserella shujinwangii]PRX44925.1 hypothetical protein B0I33_11023 [Prauserella shujinwangii]
MKYPWVTLRNGAFTSAYGPPSVRARRLDGPGEAEGTHGGFATDTGGLRFWPSGIEFPARGCWLVTGRLRGTVVRFVLEL